MSRDEHVKGKLKVKFSGVLVAESSEARKTDSGYCVPLSDVRTKCLVPSGIKGGVQHWNARVGNRVLRDAARSSGSRHVVFSDSSDEMEFEIEE